MAALVFTGRNIIAAPRPAVWNGLNDPDVLKQCIPGCEYFERASPTFLRAKMVVKIALIRMAFTGMVTQSDITPPESCHLAVKGEGPIAGLVSAKAIIRLSEINLQETEIDYDLQAEIGGRLASFGSSLISSTAQGYASRFFARLEKALAEKELHP